MNRNSKLFIALIILATGLTSCLPIKPIEFKSIDNFTVSRVGLTPEIKADVHLFNPNKTAARIQSMIIDVFVNNTKLSSVCMDSKTCVCAVGDFTVPVLATPSLVDIIKLIPSGISFLKDHKEIPVNIKGDVVIKKFLFSKHYTFDYTEKLTKDKIKVLGNFGF